MKNPLLVSTRARKARANHTAGQQTLSFADEPAFATRPSKRAKAGKGGKRPFCTYVQFRQLAEIKQRELQRRQAEQTEANHADRT